MFQGFHRLTLTLCLLIYVGFGRASAQISPDLGILVGNPYLLLADHIRGSALTQQLDLQGRVRLASENISFFADRLQLSPSEIRMYGRIKIDTPSQDLYADSLWLDRQTNAARLTNVFARDQKRYISARLLEQSPDGSLSLSELLYSTCPHCHRGTKLPWEIYARSITYDAQTEQIKIYDAQLAIFGVQILRIPFWQALNPAITRFTGYLPARLTSSNAGDTALRLGHFWERGDFEDFTAWLTLHSAGAIQVDGRYRYADATKWFTATARVSAGIPGTNYYSTFTQQEILKEDISLSGDWFINNHLRLRGEGRFFSDAQMGSFLGHDRRDHARAGIDLEYFDQGNFGRLSLSQDRQANPATPMYLQDEIPVRLQGRFEYSNDNFGTGEWVGLDHFGGIDLDVNHRVSGRDSARLAGWAGLRAPRTYLGASHLDIEVFALAGASAVRNIDTLSNAFNPITPNFTGSTGFSSAGLSLDWSLPLTRRLSGGRLNLTPRLRLTAVDGATPQGTVANEDALLPYLSSGSLFRAAYSGPLDRGFTGARADVGADMNWSRQDWRAEGFLGMRAQTNTPTFAPAFSGLGGAQSQVLTQLGLAHAPTGLSLSYLGRLPTSNAQRTSHDLRLDIPVGAWQLGLDYSYEGATTPGFGGETWGVTAAGPVTDHWQLDLYYRDDLQNPMNQEYGIKVRYEDCCFGLNFYADYDENAGAPIQSYGFEIDLIDLLVIGDRTLF